MLKELRISIVVPRSKFKLCVSQIGELLIGDLRILSLLQLGFRLVKLRQHLAGVHPRNYLTGIHRVAFSHQHFVDATSVLGCYVDFGGFDAAIAIDEARGDSRRPQEVPCISARGSDRNKDHR